MIHFTAFLYDMIKIRRNPSRQHITGGLKRKDRKTRKSRSEEKVVNFNSAQREAGSQDRTRGIVHLTRRRTPGAGIVKGWEDKRDWWLISNTFT